MFCSECGVKAGGKFCWSCGESLKQAESSSVEVVELRPIERQTDWSECLDCQTLVAIPEVRQRIARHAARATSRFSGEDFLECCDKVMGSLAGGVPLTLIAKIAQPISDKLGLKTGKSRCERLAERPGAVLVALLCSLAQNNQRIRDVVQEPNCCTLNASLPSDVWSLKGDLRIVVRAEGSVTTVEAGLTIPGQVYDWGKCNRVLDRLFADMLELTKAA